MVLTCPYCRAPFSNVENEEEATLACSACGTLHHADCFAENGGCTVFGCSQAPADEAKVSVSAYDVARPQPIAPPPPPPAPRVPPPPRLDGAPQPLAISANDFAPASGSAPPAPSNFTFAGYAPPAAPTSYSRYVRRKTRVAYVMLAIFFGSFGVHNFYAGYIKKAVIQLCLTVFTFSLAGPIIWIWAIVEACMIRQDSDGVAFS